MSSNALRWGLLSTARINRRLIPAIRASERAELVAVASRTWDRAEAYAAEWQIPRAWGSYEDLLNDMDVDVVYISLPNSLHAEWTVKAAEAGKHVLCEKPLAQSTGECDQIMAAAERTGVVISEAVMYLHHPLLHEARQVVTRGDLGRVTLVRGAFSFLLDAIENVRWEPDLGGGALWDIGSYPVSFIRWIAGEPAQVFGWQSVTNRGVDATFAGMMRCKDEVLGLFDCGFRQQFRTEAEVVGSEAVMTILRPYTLGEQSRILIRRGDQDEMEEIIVPPVDPYLCEVDAFTAAVLDGARLPVPLTSSRANVATLSTLYASARLGEPLIVPESHQIAL